MAQAFMTLGPTPNEEYPSIDSITLQRPFIMGLLLIAVLIAGFGRLLIALDLAPQLLAVVPLPMLLVSASLAVLARKNSNEHTRGLGKGLILFLVVTVVSGLLNGLELLRPAIFWAILSVPFLACWVVTKRDPGTRRRLSHLTLVLMLAYAQVPLALFQAMSEGLGDPVQGSFTGMGAGAHIAGGVALLGALVCLGRAMESGRIRGWAHWLIASTPLIVVSILSDAKQVLIAFLVAASYMVLRTPSRLYPRLFSVAGIGAMVFIAALVYPPFARLASIENHPMILAGLGGKTSSLKIVVDASRLGNGTLLFGLGPGNSISRLSRGGEGEYFKVLTPALQALLVPRLGDATAEVHRMTASVWLFQQSSVFSPFSSWIGLLGDVGAIGLASYLLLVVIVWRNLARIGTPESMIARAALLMVLLLGVLYDWLEEPVPTLLVGLMAGQALSRSTQSLQRTPIASRYPRVLEMRSLGALGPSPHPSHMRMPGAQ